MISEMKQSLNPSRIQAIQHSYNLWEVRHRILISYCLVQSYSLQLNLLIFVKSQSSCKKVLSLFSNYLQLRATHKLKFVGLNWNKYRSLGAKSLLSYVEEISSFNWIISYLLLFFEERITSYLVIFFLFTSIVLFFQEGKMSKEAFIRFLRTYAGDKLLITVIKKIRGY